MEFLNSKFFVTTLFVATTEFSSIVTPFKMVTPVASQQWFLIKISLPLFIISFLLL